MTDPISSPPGASRPENWLEPGKLNVQLVYALYLLGFVIGISTIIGVIFAYLNRGKAGGWVDTHYTWAIRTFWIGLLYGVISVLLTVAVVGVLLGIATVVWVVVRCVTGLQKASAGQPIDKPQSWLI